MRLFAEGQGVFIEWGFDIGGYQSEVGRPVVLEALDFLWLTRNELHLITRRSNDQMSFELQEEVSEGLGYGSMEEAIAASHARPPRAESTLADLRFEPDDPDLPVERFMRDYYRHARAIKSYSELVIEQCARRVEPRQGFRLWM